MTINELVEELEDSLAKAEEQSQKARDVKWFYQNGFSDGEVFAYQKVISLLKELKGEA